MVTRVSDCREISKIRDLFNEPFDTQKDVNYVVLGRLKAVVDADTRDHLRSRLHALHDFELGEVEVSSMELVGYEHEFLPIAKRPENLSFLEVDNPTIGEALIQRPNSRRIAAGNHRWQPSMDRVAEGSR